MKLRELTWNKRYKIMTELIHTPEGREEIVSELEALKETKDLSYGERKLLDKAKNWDKLVEEHKAKVVELKNEKH